MAFDFWEQQRQARWHTVRYVVSFFILLCLAAILVEVGFRTGANLAHINDRLLSPYPTVGATFMGLWVLIASGYYFSYTSDQSAKKVVEAFEARLIERTQVKADLKEQQLLNVVEEMAIAGAIAVPDVYLIPSEEINSLTAGMSQKNRAVLITEGALQYLSRDELQAMLAYEMSHVVNNDLQLGMRFAAMVMSFFFIMDTGLNLLRLMPYESFLKGKRKKSSGNNKMQLLVLIAAVAIIAGGIFMWIFGKILQHCVAQKRVYLADACSVQFTRNTDGLCGLLAKIDVQGRTRLPYSTQGFSHLCLSSAHGTHPSLAARLAAVEEQTHIPQSWLQSNNTEKTVAL